MDAAVPVLHRSSTTTNPRRKRDHPHDAANQPRVLVVFTTDVDELFKHWARLPDRFGPDCGFVTSVLGVTRLAAPQLLVLLEATAVD